MIARSANEPPLGRGHAMAKQHDTEMHLDAEKTGDYGNDWARRNQRERDAKAARIQQRKTQREAAERESNLAWRAEKTLRFMEGWG